MGPLPAAELELVPEVESRAGAVEAGADVRRGRRCADVDVGRRAQRAASRIDVRIGIDLVGDDTG